MGQSFSRFLRNFRIYGKLAMYGNLRSPHMLKFISFSTGWDIDLDESLKIGKGGYQSEENDQC